MRFQLSSKRVVALIAATTNSTKNGQDDADLTPTYYQQAPTMFFVIAGLASMLFIIVIAIVLLCYSNYINHSQNQIELMFQSSSSMNQYWNGDSRSSFSQWSSNETLHQTTPILFVLNPGQYKPTCFAQAAPILPDNATFQEHMNYINDNFLFFQKSFSTPTSVESMPVSPLQFQPHIQLQYELLGENSHLISSIFHPVESTINISHIPLPLPSNNETPPLRNMENNEINVHMHIGSLVKTTPTKIASKDLHHLRVQKKLIQNVEKELSSPILYKSMVESSTNVIPIPTPSVMDLKYKEQIINIMDERPQIVHTNASPSTSYTYPSQQGLQQNEEPQSTTRVHPIELEPINVIIHKSTTKPTNLPSIEQVDSVVRSSISKIQDVLPMPLALTPQEIPTTSTMQFQRQSYQEAANVHARNVMHPLEPSVNVITHSVQ